MDENVINETVSVIEKLVNKIIELNSDVEETDNSIAISEDEEIKLYYYNEESTNYIETVELNSLGCPECREVFKTKLKEVLKPYLSQMCPDCQSRYEKNPLRLLDCKEETCKKYAKIFSFSTLPLCFFPTKHLILLQYNCQSPFCLALFFVPLHKICLQICLLND